MLLVPIFLLTSSQDSGEVCARLGPGPSAFGIWGTFLRPTVLLLLLLIVSGPQGHGNLPSKIWAPLLLTPWFWNFSLQGNCLEGLLKYILLVPTLRVHNSAKLGWDPIICFSSKFTGENHGLSSLFLSLFLEKTGWESDRLVPSGSLCIWCKML